MLLYTMLGVSVVLTVWILSRYKEYFIWFIFERLLALRYNIIPMQTHHIPKDQPVLLMGNHISWIDWILVQVGIERRIRYLMERSIYEKPFIRPIMELGEVIPISSKGAKEAFAHARERLQKGEIIGLFPEGSISHSGEMGTFMHGYTKIAADSKGVIIPFYICGAYGSLFSRSAKRHTPLKGWFRRTIRIIYGEPLPIESEPHIVYNAIIHLKETYGTQQA